MVEDFDGFGEVTPPGPPSGTSTNSFFVPRANESFVYDADGNLKEDSRWFYVYDGENRLIWMESKQLAVPTAWRRQIQYDYDSQGRLICRRVNKQQTVFYPCTPNAAPDSCSWHYYVPDGQPNCFLYDGWNRLAEFPGGGQAITRSYAWKPDLSGTLHGAGGVGGLGAIVDHTAGNKAYFVHSDPLGNVTHLLDASSGALVSELDYLAFGQCLAADAARIILWRSRIPHGLRSRQSIPLHQTPVGAKNNFRFSSKFEDPETGLVYYGYRWLNPSLGRWLSRDPIEESGGVNLYAFLRNRAVNSFDIDGRREYENYSGEEGFTPSDLDDDDFDVNVPPAIDGALKSALETIMVPGRTPCLLRCYLPDLSEEDTQEMLTEIIASTPLEEREFLQTYVSRIPGSVSAKFLTFASTVHTLTSRTPQGIGTQDAAIHRLTPRVATIRLVRKKVFDKSVAIMGKNGVKYFGRLGSKVLPIVGLVSLGYEGYKACICWSACEDGKFTNAEKIFGQ